MGVDAEARACVSTRRNVFCGAGCSSGACNACPGGNRAPFVDDPPLTDRCEVDELTLEEWANDPSDPSCQRYIPVDAFACQRACFQGACVCVDTDRRSPFVPGVDAFGRTDECDGDDLLERWTEPAGSLGCEAREVRISCTYGCQDGRCLPRPGAPTFTFACVPFGTHRPAHVVDLQCRRGVAEFVDNAGIGEMVDVAITTVASPVPRDRVAVDGDDLTADVASVPGDMLILLTDTIGGGTTSSGYALAGARWIVAEIEPLDEDNVTIPHEVGHVLSIVRRSGTIAGGVCLEDECEHICDERSIGVWGTQDDQAHCVNPYPASCAAAGPDVLCTGHLLDPAEGVYCYYGDLSALFSPPRRAYSFAAEERAHLQRWFATWRQRDDPRSVVLSRRAAAGGLPLVGHQTSRRRPAVQSLRAARVRRSSDRLSFGVDACCLLCRVPCRRALRRIGGMRSRRAVAGRAAAVAPARARWSCPSAGFGGSPIRGRAGWLRGRCGRGLE